MAAGTLVLVAGCASEEATPSATTTPETAPATDTGPSAELGPATDTTAELAVDPCTLVSDETLAEVFPTGAPEPDGTDYGGGFSDCTWDAPDGFLGVTLVPANDFPPDFVDQLSVGEPPASDELGPDAVSFTGTAGVGSGPSGGATVGFVMDDTAALVAVRSGEEGDLGDLDTATRIAEEVANGP